MLTPYANSATKQIIVSLSGSKGFCETLIESKDYRNKEKADAHLKIALEELQLALNDVCEGLDRQQMQGILKFANNSQLAVMPSTSQSINKEYIVSAEDMRTILRGAVSECVFCLKEGKKAKNCAIKKALLASQVVPMNIHNTNCPYHGD